MKKSTIFIICLLCIVSAELFMVWKNGVDVKPQTYSLDAKTYDMPKRETDKKVVKPFLFEMHTANEVDAILDEFAADITKSMAQHEAIKSKEILLPTPVKEKQVVEVVPADEAVAVEEVVSEPEIMSSDISEEAAVAESLFNGKIKEPEVAVVETVEEQAQEPQEVIETPQPVTEANPVETTEKRDRVAIVIDDVGLSIPFVREIAQVKAPLTVSFLPYGASGKEQVITLKDAGFEVLVHVPMMPHVPAALAPVTLSPEMDKEETQSELNKMLDRFEGTGIVGVNNHMGSLLTERAKNMGYIMEVLKKRGMFFLDSKTTGKSAAGKVAKEYGVEYISRDVFLDNKNDYNYIMGQFKQTEKKAHKNGYAVAIGHPYSQTLKALKDWLKEADKNGIEIVHVSELLAKE